ncbi:MULTISPECIES: toxin-antitoxin system HicB family antitoxin [Myroides]|uniref:toxin-antitoxin system HicB family antitoxin n=1 Tax=Myroides TaxID=76831 RepID=UPI00057F3262|nr:MULTISPECIES: hypothetical protein [Myroides]AJA70271.1 hypothetical protein MYRA21_3174 [Myroides sp. A21]SHL58051.1 hypothetical protein SAMN05444275_10591 [Myroides odoratimimus subsp. xuanwuensis]
MNTLNFKKATSLRLDNDLYNYIEMLAKKENRSINNFIEKTLAEATHFHELNEETIQAIEDAQKEKMSSKRFDNTHDLLNDLMRD